MKKTNSGFSIVVFLLLICLVAFVSYTGYLIASRDNTPGNNAGDNTISEDRDSGMVILKVKELLQEQSVLKEFVPPADFSKSRISYLADGYDYRSSVESDNTMSFQLVKSSYDTYRDEYNENGEMKYLVEDRAVIQPIADIVINKLESTGFSKSTDQDKSILFNGDTLYESNMNVCVLSSYVAIVLTCEPKSAFKESAEKVKPFIAPFRSAMIEINQGVEISNESFRLAETGTGDTDSDIYAIVDYGEASAYFFEENGAWVYYNSSQDGIGCSLEYPSTKAKASFSKICVKDGTRI